MATRRLRRMANGAADDALIMLVFYHDAVATVNRAGNISLHIAWRVLNRAVVLREPRVAQLVPHAHHVAAVVELISQFLARLRAGVFHREWPPAPGTLPPARTIAGCTRAARPGVRWPATARHWRRTPPAAGSGTALLPCACPAPRWTGPRRWRNRIRPAGAAPAIPMRPRFPRQGLP